MTLALHLHQKLQMKEAVFYFLLFSMVGWIYEVALAFLYGHGFVNRGFLFGPYLPLYGFGALILIICLSPLMRKDLRVKGLSATPAAVFLMIMLITTALEYAASVILEAVFHTRWWDYSTYTYQLHGRIALSASVRFGIGGMLFLYLLRPLFARLYGCIPQRARSVVAWVVAGVIAADFAFSLYRAVVYGVSPVLAQPK